MSETKRDNVLALAAATGVCAVMFLTGWLMRPVYPDPPYFVEWQPVRESYASYAGAVLNGGVAQIQLLRGPTPQSEIASELLRRGAPLGVWTLIGPQSTGIAPLIALYDGEGEEVAVLAVDRADLLFRQHTRAREWGLNDVVVRAPGVLDSLAAGDSARLASGASPIGRCFDVATTRYCGIGFTGGSMWAFFFDPAGITLRMKTVLDGIVLAIIALPIGLLASPGVALLLILGIGWYAMFRVPIDTVLLPTPVLALLMMSAGIAAGLLLRWLLRRRNAARR